MKKDYLQIVEEQIDDDKKVSQQIIDDIVQSSTVKLDQECDVVFDKFRKTNVKEEWNPKSPVDKFEVSRFANDQLLMQQFWGTSNGVELEILRA